MTKVKVEIHRTGTTQYEQGEFYWVLAFLSEDCGAKEILAIRDYATARSAERAVRKFAGKHLFAITEVEKAYLSSA